MDPELKQHYKEHNHKHDIYAIRRELTKLKQTRDKLYDEIADLQQVQTKLLRQIEYNKTVIKCNLPHYKSQCATELEQFKQQIHNDYVAVINKYAIQLRDEYDNINMAIREIASRRLKIDYIAGSMLEFLRD